MQHPTSVLHAASVLFSSSILLPFIHFSPARSILFPSSELLPRPSHTLLPITYFHAASRFLLSPSVLLSTSCLYSPSCFTLTLYTEISSSSFFFLIIFSLRGKRIFLSHTAASSIDYSADSVFTCVEPETFHTVRVQVT